MYMYGSPSLTILDNNFNLENNGVDVSYLIECKSRIEFDSVLFLHRTEFDNMSLHSDEKSFIVEPIYNETMTNNGKYAKYNVYILLLTSVFMLGLI